MSFVSTDSLINPIKLTLKKIWGSEKLGDLLKAIPIVSNGAKLSNKVLPTPRQVHFPVFVNSSQRLTLMPLQHRWSINICYFHVYCNSLVLREFLLLCHTLQHMIRRLQRITVYRIKWKWLSLPNLAFYLKRWIERDKWGVEKDSTNRRQLERWFHWMLPTKKKRSCNHPHAQQHAQLGKPLTSKTSQGIHFGSTAQ